MNRKTSFSLIYDAFLTRVTSDMYMEMTEVDTIHLLQDLLIISLPRFEFPRFDISDYEEGGLIGIGTYSGVASEYATVEASAWIGGYFNSVLTEEEINIISLSMVVEWLGQQLATTENTRLKYSSEDYKFSSQANHMAKIKLLMETYRQECFHLQRLYKRRKLVDGKLLSTAGNIMTTPTYGYKIGGEL